MSPIVGYSSDLNLLRMNVVEALTKEHSARQKNRIVNYVGHDPKRFRQLIDVFLGDTYRLTQRAAWPLSDIVKKHPELITPYLGRILRRLDDDEMHVAVRRNVIRLLQFIDIPEKYKGLAFEKCMSLLSDPGQAIAVRVFAITVMADIADSEPDLRNEVIIAIEDHLPYGSAGYRNRAGKLLKKLKGSQIKVASR